MPTDRAGDRAAATIAVLLLLAGLSGVGAVTRWSQPIGPAGRFRTGTDLVRLVVVVTDRDGQAVTGLPREAFVVLDRGRPVPIASFSDTRTPVDLLVLLDTSASMTPHRSEVLAVLGSLVDGLPAPHAIRIVGFGTRIVPITEWTADPDRIRTAIAKLTPAGPTPLYTAIVVAARLSAERRDPDRKAALLVCSDGQNTTDLHREDDAIAAATEAGLPILAVWWGQAVSGRFDSGAMTLRTLARTTGGIFFSSLSPPTGAAVASWIASAYVVAFEPWPPRPPAGTYPVRVVVVGRPDLAVRTRQTYTIRPGPNN